jgi:hypothetical protein
MGSESRCPSAADCHPPLPPPGVPHPNHVRPGLKIVVRKLGIGVDAE